MDSDDASIILAVVGLMMLLLVFAGAIFTAVAPFVFLVIFKNIPIFIYWFKISMIVLRWGEALAIPLGIIMVLLDPKRLHHIYLIPYRIAMIIWGIPTYTQSVISLMTEPLSGLELQRTIFLVILIAVIRIRASMAGKEDAGEETEFSG